MNFQQNAHTQSQRYGKMVIFESDGGSLSDCYTILSALQCLSILKRKGEGRRVGRKQNWSSCSIIEGWGEAARLCEPLWVFQGFCPESLVKPSKALSRVWHDLIFFFLIYSFKNDVFLLKLGKMDDIEHGSRPSTRQLLNVYGRKSRIIKIFNQMSLHGLIVLI